MYIRVQDGIFKLNTVERINDKEVIHTIVDGVVTRTTTALSTHYTHIKKVGYIIKQGEHPTDCILPTDLVQTRNGNFISLVNKDLDKYLKVAKNYIVAIYRHTENDYIKMIEYKKIQGDQGVIYFWNVY